MGRDLFLPSATVSSNNNWRRIWMRNEWRSE